jgi:5'-phosphate synthase pdxT subunit
MAATVGVLALQGAVELHLRAVRAAGADPRLVRLPDEVAAVDALIIPGGESTTMGILMGRFGLAAPISRLAEQGRPILGTCAGMILLARDIAGSDQPRLGLMDIRVVRNSFGRQVDSFEADIAVPALGGEPFHGLFIRAPHIESVGRDVQVLAEYQSRIVLARQGRLLAASFHPELTDDRRVHEYFLRMVNA